MSKKSKFDSIKTIFYAIFIALLIRSLIAEPFNIPSGSMKPTLLVGDFLFVKKWSYGYSKHSLPFSLPIIKNRIFYSLPNRGDVAVFKTPSDNNTDYVKRIIGLPGDKVQLFNGVVYINDKPVSKIQIENFVEIDKYNNIFKIAQFEEEIFGKIYKTLDINYDGVYDNTIEYLVPENHFFVLGDNRDNSQDSRFLKSVGFIPKENLVGKAWFIFFSLNDSRFYEIWKWPYAIRGSRIFKLIKWFQI